MVNAFQVVLGMTIAYLASLAGMFFAWYHWRKREREAGRRLPEQLKEQEHPR
jgi:hypothetical protein